MPRISRATTPVDIEKPKTVRRMRLPSGVAPKVRPRRKSGEMNDTEKRFEESVLKPQLSSGVITAYYFECLTWLIAPGCRYTADFLVVYADGSVKLIDVKGGTGRIGNRKPYIEDDARVKMKATDYYSPFPVLVAFEERRGEFHVAPVSQEIEEE